MWASCEENWPRPTTGLTALFVRLSDTICKVFRMLVEAAGVEPASEIAVSQESPCSVRFRMFSPPALRTDKMR
jgi:hypothetical protein